MAVVLFALTLGLDTRHNDFPFTYHPDEGGKVAQVLLGSRNYHHPLLLLSDHGLRLAGRFHGARSANHRPDRPLGFRGFRGGQCRVRRAARLVELWAARRLGRGPGGGAPGGSLRDGPLYEGGPGAAFRARPGATGGACLVAATGPGFAALSGHRLRPGRSWKVSRDRRALLRPAAGHLASGEPMPCCRDPPG